MKEARAGARAAIRSDERRLGATSRDGMRYVGDRVRRRRRRGHGRATRLDELDDERGTARQPPLLPRGPARARSRRSSTRRSAPRRASGTGWTRLVVEKPFGHDLDSRASAERRSCSSTSPRTRSSGSTTTSARRPSRTCWRCASPTASSSRSGTASTSTTCRSPSPRRSASRAAASFYEQTGAIRDIVQNHLLQLLALTAMEPPIDFTADAGAQREGEGAALACTRPARSRVVRGQYGRGFVEGEEVPGYREEADVAPGLADRDVRRREALRRQLALGRHAVLRARRQAARAARDDDRDPVQARAAPAVRGDGRPRACGRTCCVIHIQPDEGISLAIGAKVPGAGHDDPHTCTWTSSTAARSAPSCPRRTSG